MNSGPLYTSRYSRKPPSHGTLIRLWRLRGHLQNLMMIRTLQGESIPRRRTWTRLCIGVAVTATLALTLAYVRTAAAEGMNATRTRPVRVRRSAAVQSETPKAGATKPNSAKPNATHQGSARQGSKSSLGAGEKRSGADQPSTSKTPQRKSRRHAKKAEDDDMPMMEQVRGRRGRAHPAMRRVAMRRSVPISPREAPSVLAGTTTSLRGTHDVLVHQNLMANDEGLNRIQTDADLERMREDFDLIDFVQSRSLRINPELPDDRRCARPWTVRFADDLARDFYDTFGMPLQVNSAARSVEYQLHLAHINGNAAGVDGDTSSPHLTGQAIDFGKKDMSRAELAWMRARLLPLMQAGKIDVEEEFRQACFHISVYRTYLPPTHELAIAPVAPTAQSVQ
jgi:hypothetical protein